GGKMKRSGSIRIARIRGIDLKIHFSLIFLLIYVIFIAAVQFPITVAQSGVNGRSLIWNPPLWGVIIAIGLFISVALHEFGHAFVAQAQGVKVKGITLMMLGGISEM